MSEWKREIRKRLAGSKLRPEREAEIIEEFSSHLQDQYSQLRAGGATHEEAFRSVVAELDATDETIWPPDLADLIRRLTG